MTLREMIILTASYYSKTLSEPLLDMYAEDLSDLPVNAVLSAYQAYRRNPKNKAFPLPAQIREIVAPEADPEAEARAILDRIITAINKFGWPQGEAAKAYVGPIGWRIVENNGGWMKLCESNFIHNPGLLAQARNRAEDLIKYGDSFRSDSPQIESKKFEALKVFEKHLSEQPVEIEIPSDEDRARMIGEILERANNKELTK